MIKVLIADDQELIRQSLQIVLNSRPDIMLRMWPPTGRRSSAV